MRGWAGSPSCRLTWSVRHTRPFVHPLATTLGVSPQDHVNQPADNFPQSSEPQFLFRLIVVRVFLLQPTRTRSPKSPHVLNEAPWSPRHEPHEDPARSLPSTSPRRLYPTGAVSIESNEVHLRIKSDALTTSTPDHRSLTSLYSLNLFLFAPTEHEMHAVRVGPGILTSCDTREMARLNQKGYTTHNLDQLRRGRVTPLSTEEE